MARGHQVTLVTLQPRGIVTRDEISGIRVRYVHVPQPGRPRPRYGLDEITMFALPAFASSATATADVIHCWHYVDAAAVVRRGRPLLLKITGSITPEWIKRTPLQDRLLRRGLRRPDGVWCNSEWVRSQMSGFGRPMDVVPAGVDRDLFRPVAERSAGPTVLSTCAPNEPRKRLTDLVDAWPRVRAAVPDARLRLAGDASPDLVDALLSRIPEPDRGSIRFLGSLDTADLAGEYSSAWVSVMPAVLEALGLSTLESLACGTPVVGADSGTTAALLADPAAGRLFRPAEPDDLARAVIEQLAATDRVDRDRCRGLTDAYDWERITDRVEAAYLALAG